MTSGGAWPGEETVETADARPRVHLDEGRSEAIRRNAAAQGDFQTLALLEVSAAIDRLALVLKDAVRGGPPR